MLRLVSSLSRFIKQINVVFLSPKPGQLFQSSFIHFKSRVIIVVSLFASYMLEISNIVLFSFALLLEINCIFRLNKSEMKYTIRKYNISHHFITGIFTFHNMHYNTDLNAWFDYAAKI